ncbi:MAG TPA: hypothetical protein VM661_13355 [Candidatus Sulfotelmatobacter sp.]|jgi:hypothetical protein|nr:hypothetical protein [Candidatus Sulfotelmatobacter sp.]
MSPASLQSAQDARQELEKVSSLVLAARRLMAKGSLVDLSAIQERVAAICAAVESMPREDGRSLLEELTDLIRRLDSLGNDIADQIRQMADKMDRED